MGITNLRHSLEKKFAALTGELQEVYANIARLQREQAKLPELEVRIPKIVQRTSTRSGVSSQTLWSQRYLIREISCSMAQHHETGR